MPYFDILDDQGEVHNRLKANDLADAQALCPEGFTVVELVDDTRESRRARREYEAAVRSEAARRMQELTSEYTPEERDTWATQVTDAREIIAGTLTVSPMIQPLADARGITLFEMANIVLYKADLYAQASGIILGAQSRLIHAEEMVTDIYNDEHWV